MDTNIQAKALLEQGNELTDELAFLLPVLGNQVIHVNGHTIDLKDIRANLREILQQLYQLASKNTENHDV